MENRLKNMEKKLEGKQKPRPGASKRSQKKKISL